MKASVPQAVQSYIYRGQTTFMCIPNGVARRLVQEALVYVNDKAESIVSTREAATAAQEWAKARGVAHPDSLSTIAITVARGHS
jgi:hypothetical protein